jgi:PAS domain S-box-containing protein
MPRVRFIYLMREVQGKVIFLADSEPPGSPDESPPGQVYEEASSGIRDAFANGKSIVEGPDTDRWGTWVSGYAPLNDVRTGQPFAVLGVDLDAQDYSAAIALERLKAISFIALFCAIALLALAYYRRFTEVMGQPEAMSDMFLRWGMLGIVVMAGVSLTSFIYLSARNTAQDSFQTVFQQRAVGRVEVVSQALELQIDRLDGVRRFIDHADVITRDEFEHYAGPLTVDTPLQALEWIPRVSREERAQYEDKARQDGLIGFQITEKTSDGSLVPAGDRDEYFPVYYVTPLQGNEAAAGYDLASNALRRATIEKARDGGLAVATEPVRLVQASGDTSGILVFVPVYRGPAPQTVEERRRNLRGYILGVYRGEQFLKSVYSAMPAEGLTALIEDPLAPAGRQVLYRHKLRAGTIDWDHLRMKYEVPLVMADREWRITIAPGSSFVEANLSTGYRWVLPFGCLLTGLLALFLNTLLLGRFRSEELVRQRTAELSREKEALRESQKRFEQVAKQSREVIFEVDNKGLYTYVSELCYDIYGYTANEMVGKKYLYDLFPAEDREALTREVFASFGRKEVFRDFINPIVHRNGTTVLLSTNATPVLDGRGNLLGYLGLDRDITEAKRAEDKLLKSEERYRKITSSITDYIYTVRIENGRPGSTIYNPGCMAVTGYSVEEFLSRPSLWLEIVVPEDRLIVEKQIREVFTRANVEPIEHRITHKDGRIRWVRNTIVPQYDAHANMTSYDGLVTDITERKKAEESLKLAKEAAEKALTIKDEFTSTVSHELRTPLAAMKSSIDILATEAPGKLTDDQKVFLKRVKSNIDRLARLINDVLDLSKIESGKMAMNFVPLRPGELVQEVVESQREVANSKGLALETVFGSDLPVLLADKDRLTQVFNNLINNAIKFTQAGKITVSAFCENKLKMVFCVRDTGVGIKEEDLAKLFEKFQQVGGLSQQLGGTGLGLAICREIVSRHGGRIWAESEFGKGSSFFFSIPVRKAKRVLVVDDDRSVQELIKHLLEGTGLYEVGLASDGFEAGQRYHDFEPSLIVLDIGLPKMSGLAVCARIKGDPKTMHTSILIMSSFSTEDQVRAAWDAGCDDIMKKPFNPREVLAKVEKLA